MGQQFALSLMPCPRCCMRRGRRNRRAGALSWPSANRGRGERETSAVISVSDVIGILLLAGITATLALLVNPARPDAMTSHIHRGFHRIGIALAAIPMAVAAWVAVGGF